MSTITTIQATDLITNSRTDINTNFSNLNTDKVETSVLDTDTALAANSDSKIATQKAVKAYVDAGGNVNASETSKGIVEEATDAEVTAGTATGGTGAKLVVTPAKLKTFINAPKFVFSTIFETAARFTSINDSGTSTYNTAGFTMDTTSTATRASGLTGTIHPFSSVFLGSPTTSISLCYDAISMTTGSAYYGLGAVTKSGAGHTYTTDHCGFKVIFAAGVPSLYATQGDGTTENASSALTTIAAQDQIALAFKINGTSSIDYYWQKNGGAWSSATNLTANMPDTTSTVFQLSCSNNGTSAAHQVSVQCFSYTR